MQDREYEKQCERGMQWCGVEKRGVEKHCSQVKVKSHILASVAISVTAAIFWLGFVSGLLTGTALSPISC
jgi:hypothetical protein